MHLPFSAVPSSLLSQGLAQSHGAWSRRGGSVCVSLSGCQLSQLTQLATPSLPHPASSLLTFHFQACLVLLSEGEHPLPLPGVAAAPRSTPIPAGLVGPLSGQFESAEMESSEYRSRCSQQGPGEDHLTGRWVTQREGKGWEPESPGPRGLEEVKLSPSGRLSREEAARDEEG